MNNTSSVNTILLVVVVVLLIGGGIWWYKTYGPGAPKDDGSGLQINIGDTGN